VIGEEAGLTAVYSPGQPYLGWPARPATRRRLPVIRLGHPTATYELLATVTATASRVVVVAHDPVSAAVRDMTTDGTETRPSRS
jgi:hypothetical protein